MLSLSSPDFHKVIEFFEPIEDFRKMIMLNTKNLRHLTIEILTSKLVVVSSFKDIANISEVATRFVN